MRGVFKNSSVVLTAVLLVACASAVPPTRIGDYVSSERRVGDEAFPKGDQRPLQAGLVLVSDTSDPGAAPNLPEEALVRLGETLKQDIGRAIPVVIKEIVSHTRSPETFTAALACLSRSQGSRETVELILAACWHG